MKIKRIYTVGIGRLAASGLAFVFTITSPIILTKDELASFYAIFSLLAFLSILPRLGSEYFFFDKPRTRKVTINFLFYGLIISTIISLIAYLVSRNPFVFILPFLSLAWITSSYMKTIGKFIQSQTIEFYILYIILIGYLSWSMLTGTTRMINYFFSVAIIMSFSFSLVMLYKNKVFSNFMIKAKCIPIVFKKSTATNILIMYGNYFLAWGPILIFQFFSTSSHDFGNFSIAYKYLAVILLIHYFVHIIYSKELSKKHQDYGKIQQRSKSILLVMLVLNVAILLFINLTFLIQIEYLYYFSLMLPFFSLLISQSVKTHLLIYNKKTTIASINSFVFMLLAILSLLLNWINDGITITNFIALLNAMLVLNFVLVELQYKKLKNQTSHFFRSAR